MTKSRTFSVKFLEMQKRGMDNPRWKSESPIKERPKSDTKEYGVWYYHNAIKNSKKLGRNMLKGKDSPKWKGGKPFCAGGCGHRMTNYDKAYCIKCIGKMRSGENNPRWVADRTKLQRYGDDNKDRRSSAYNAWRRAVWLRDNFACKIGNPDCAGRIEAHHILGWKENPELRYEVNNGITLCHFHHPRKRNDEVRLSPYFKEIINTKHF